MQIYGILLNIRGILLKNREKQRKSENFRENHSFSFLNTPILCSKMLNITRHNKIVIFLFGRT